MEKKEVITRPPSRKTHRLRRLAKAYFRRRLHLLQCGLQNGQLTFFPRFSRSLSPSPNSVDGTNR